MIRTFRPFDPHSIKFVVFDLDGTLIDSRLDLVHSVNAALRHIGRPELPDDVIASYVGDGAPILIQRALGGEATDEALIRKGLQFFLSTTVNTNWITPSCMKASRMPSRGFNNLLTEPRARWRY